MLYDCGFPFPVMSHVPLKTQRFHSFIRSRLHWSIEASFAWCEMGRQAPLPHCRQQGEPIRRGWKSFLCTSYSLKYQPQGQQPSKIVLLQCDPYAIWVLGGHLLRARFSCCCCKQDLWNFPVYFRNEESHTDSQELSTTEVLGNGLWLVSCSMCWCC